MFAGFVDKQSDFFGEEVQKCIHLAKNRIHAIFFVVSIEICFSKEDQKDAIRNLQTIFGENIINYMIIVFTGDGDRGNELSKDHEFVSLCEGRYVLLDNETTDAVKRSEQAGKLFAQLLKVLSKNEGKPFMSQLFELQLQVESTMRDATTRLEQLAAAHATTMNANKEQTAQRIDAVESRLRDTTTRLEQQMEAATLKADERAEKYLKEETSELIQRISKSYEDQMTQRLEAAVQQRVLVMTTRLEQQQTEAHATQMKVNEIAQQQMTQRFNEVEARLRDTMNAEEISKLIQHLNKSNQEQTTQRIDAVEARLRDTTTSLKQQMEVATLKADVRAEIYLKEETSKLIKQISKSYEEEMTQRLEVVEQRVLDTTTRLQQQLAEAYAAQMKVNKIARKQMKQRINQEVESRVKDVTTRLEQQLAEAEAARLKAEERAQEAQRNSDELISEFGSSSFHVYDPSTYLLQSTIK